MTATVIRLFGIAVIAIFASLLLKERYRSASFAVTVAAVVMMITATLGGAMGDTVGEVLKLAGGTDFSKYASTLLKALGIAYITSITENICREAGEGALAAAVETCGKAELLVLSMPLVSSLLEIAKTLL